MKDLVYAVRKRKNAPTFATTLVLTIVLSIGAGTAIFSVANAVLLPTLARNGLNVAPTDHRVNE